MHRRHLVDWKSSVTATIFLESCHLASRRTSKNSHRRKDPMGNETPTGNPSFRRNQRFAGCSLFQPALWMRHEINSLVEIQIFAIDSAGGQIMPWLRQFQRDHQPHHILQQCSLRHKLLIERHDYTSINKTRLGFIPQIV